MLNPPSHTKIRPTHLERHAFIYVRQSTLMQVREHTASTARQYDLTQRAHDLGCGNAVEISGDGDVVILTNKAC